MIKDKLERDTLAAFGRELNERLAIFVLYSLAIMIALTCAYLCEISVLFYTQKERVVDDTEATDRSEESEEEDMEAESPQTEASKAPSPKNELVAAAKEVSCHFTHSLKSVFPTETAARMQSYLTRAWLCRDPLTL